MIKNIFRYKENIFWTIVFPIALFVFLMILNTGVYSNEKPDLEINFGIIMEEQFTGFTKNLFENTFKNIESDKNNSFKFIYLEQTDDYNKIFDTKDIDLLLVFPKEFNNLNEKIMNLETQVPKIKVLYSSKSISVLGKDIINSIINEMNLNINEFQQENETEININYISDKNTFNIADFLFPSVLIMTIMTVSFFNMPLTIVEYVQNGIFKRISITPAKKIDYFISFLISQFLLLILAVILLFFASRLYTISENIYSLKFISYIIFSSITGLSFGLLFASFFKKLSTLDGIANIMFFITMFLSGLFFDISNLPGILKFYTRINPITYLVDGMRNILINKPLETNMIIIPIIWFIASIVIFSYNFKKVKE
jgi:ABC-2 type transport system permease protein